MATPNPLGSNQSITLYKTEKTIIKITKRTVRFSDVTHIDVYPTQNIAGFTEGNVDMETIPWWIIILVFFASSIIIYMGNSELGLFLSIASIGGAVWNFFKPKYYGLLLTLNSGHQTLFVTTDKKGLKKVIWEVYDYIEKEKNGSYTISMNNSQVTGDFIQGDDNKSAS